MVIQGFGHEACSGCSLCLLACPVWYATRDLRMTPHGRAKALQQEAKALDIAESVDNCTLCGACEPACPEGIRLVGMVMALRAELFRIEPGRAVVVPRRMTERSGSGARAAGAKTLLIADRALGAEPSLLSVVLRLIGGGALLAEDNGGDIAHALEAGAPISAERLARFLAPLRRSRRLIVGDGLLYRTLRTWLPGARMESLGEVLSSLPQLRNSLSESDLYVIEPRAYHADRERLVNHYNALLRACGCCSNLDMQRLAIPTTAGAFRGAGATTGRVDPVEQARWIIEGREFARIVVEDLNDMPVFKAITDKPVVYLAQLESSRL